MTLVRIVEMACLLMASMNGSAIAQIAWQVLEQPADPGPRSDVAMVYDSLRDHVLLFGGWNGADDLSDTWIWDGETWALQSPTTVPGPHSSNRLVYDERRDRIVTFGGFNDGALLGDTWEWDGSNWIEHLPADRPSPRFSYAMCYDRVRGVTVLFGGACDELTCVLGDTWEWDGAEWSQRITATTPLARHSASMAYDEAREQLVMFGGRGPGSRLSDTWVYDGIDWRQLTPATIPTSRSNAGMVYDALRERIVLFGGFTGTAFRRDTWEWDGVDWRVRVLGLRPAARAFAAMVFDGSQTLLYGGAAGGAPFADIWAAQTRLPASFTSVGAGCAGMNGVPELMATSLAWAGDRLELELRSEIEMTLPFVPAAFIAISRSNTALGPHALPLDLAMFGAPGCILYIGDSQVHAVDLLAGGRWGRTVPDDSSLYGASFYGQGVVTDATHPLGLVLSNAGEGIVGLR